MALVATAILMFLLALFVAIANSIVASSIASYGLHLQSAQALAMAQGGARWYVEQLQADSDWSNEADQTKSFADGTFTISINSLTPATGTSIVKFTSTGKVTSQLSGGIVVKRRLTLEAWHLPSSSKFAVFQGMNPMTALTLADNAGNPTTVRGNFWSKGSVLINAPNQIVPQAGGYYDTTQTMTGTGQFTPIPVSAPTPTMPVLNTAYYDALMSGYNTLLSSNTSTVDYTQTGGAFPVSGTMNYRSFTLTDVAAVTGNGTVVTKNLSIATTPGGGGTIINPDTGGTITLLSGGNLTLSSNTASLTAEPDVTLYAGRPLSGMMSMHTQTVQIEGPETTLYGPMVMSSRQINVQTGADVLGDSTIYLPHNSLAQIGSNFIQISGGTGVTTVEGSILSSTSQGAASGIKIINGGLNRTDTVVRGLVYASGRCQVENATIKGTVLCNSYLNERLLNVDADNTNSHPPLNLPPKGFENYVMVRTNSVDEL